MSDNLLCQGFSPKSFDRFRNARIEIGSRSIDGVVDREGEEEGCHRLSMCGKGDFGSIETE